MAYNAIMTVDAKKFKVRHCSYSLHQNLDENGRPASNVMGGTIQVEVESSDDNALLDWMIDPVGQKDGEISFSKTDQAGELKKIKFSKAYLTSYSESMDAISNSPMTENIVISAKSIEVGSSKHENVWESKFS